MLSPTHAENDKYHLKKRPDLIFSRIKKVKPSLKINVTLKSSFKLNVKLVDQLISPFSTLQKHAAIKKTCFHQELNQQSKENVVFNLKKGSLSWNSGNVHKANWFNSYL